MQLRINAGVDKLLPGLTDWAQVNGRDEIAITQKVELEKEYLEKKSIWFDIKIIVMTIKNIVLGKDVSH